MTVISGIALLPIAGFAQSYAGDSLSIAKNVADSVEMIAVGSTEITAPAVRFPGVYLVNNLPTRTLTQYRSANALDLQIRNLQITPGATRLLGWNNGGILATGTTTQLPGLMTIDSGTLGIYQTFGKFTFNAGGIANKYGYYNGLHTQYGLNMSIGYQFSTRLSATVFGEHYFGTLPGEPYGTPMTPAMIGYFGRSTYGGYLDFQINEHWGVQTGVQTVQQIGTNKFQPEPIVTPYYKINKKVAIGLPVGQILYHVLRK